MATYQQFFSDVLTQLGYPVTQSNLDALGAVAHLEGLNDRYNPLNSVVQSGDSTSFNSVGVQDYKSYSNGVAGTVALLRGNAWQNVDQELQQGNSAGAVLSAFQAEYATWGSHVSFDATAGAAVLPQSIGSGTPGTDVSSTTYGPYNPSSLSAPLTPTQRQQIISWLVGVTYGSIKIPGQTSTPPAGQTQAQFQAQLTAADDATLIKDYTAEYSFANMKGIPGSSPLSGIGALENVATAALGWITNSKNWIRIGIFAGAIVLVLFSAALLFRDDTPLGVVTAASKTVRAMGASGGDESDDSESDDTNEGNKS